MRRIRSILAVPAALIALGVALTAPNAATAAQPAARPHFSGQTITADLNGDHIPDHATLGGSDDPTNTTCTVTVAFGLAGGGYGTPTVHSYTSAETQGPFCPDIGVAVKLGTRSTFDLVTSFRFGFRDVVVLRNFQPLSTIFQGITQPDQLVAANLAGNGRQDVIEISSQVSELASMTNTATGQLTLGPIFVPVLRPQFVLADFQGRGGQDILVAGADPRSGSPTAQVVFGNGRTPVTLLTSNNFQEKFTVFTLDIGLDGIPDVGVIDSLNGTVTVHNFLNDGRGNFTQTA